MIEGSNPPINELEKYLTEIDDCTNQVVRRLSEDLGKETIARFLSHLSKHNTLAEPNYASKIESGSVLCGDDIESFCKLDIPLIDYPRKDYQPKIEAASFQLRLGSRCRVVEQNGSDKIMWLSDSEKVLRIPPHGIAVVSTYEWLNIPGCLIGRWNLKVKKVYEGLVWVGSLQVDPGYQGFLFCPIYNLSNDYRELIYKDPLFTIDFVRTSPGENGKYKIWSLPPNRYATFDFDRLDEKKIKSAPLDSFNKIDIKLKAFEEKVEESKTNLENKMERQFEINLVLIGILFTAIGIIGGFGLGTVQWNADWIPTVLEFFALVLALGAIIISVYSSRKRR